MALQFRCAPYARRLVRNPVVPAARRISNLSPRASHKPILNHAMITPPQQRPQALVCHYVPATSMQALPRSSWIMPSLSNQPSLRKNAFNAPPIRKMATIKQRIISVRDMIKEDPDYYRTSFWIIGTAILILLYLWKEYLAGGSGTVMDVTEMTFSQRLDERRHGFLALMNIAADPAYRINVMNGPGTVGQLVRAVTRAKDDLTAAYALAAVAFLAGHEAIRPRLLRQLSLAEVIERTRKRLAMVDPSGFTYYTMNINCGRLLASFASDAKFVDEVIKAGGVKIAASLLSEENMHYTYTGALLMANLAQHAGAMPALIQERAYAPLMDWLVRTQTSTVPQTETKGQVIRALRAIRDTLPTRSTIEAFEALKTVSDNAASEVDMWSVNGEQLSETWEAHGKRLVASIVSGFSWGYLRQAVRGHAMKKAGLSAPRSPFTTAALNAYASAGLMLGVIGWESFIAPMAARSASPSAVKFTNAIGIAAGATALYGADKHRLFVVLPSILSNVVPIYSQANGFAKAGYEQLLTQAMVADARSSMEVSRREPDNDESTATAATTPSYQGPNVSQLTRAEREWEVEKKQMEKMRRLPRPAPIAPNDQRQ